MSSKINIMSISALDENRINESLDRKTQNMLRVDKAGKTVRRRQYQRVNTGVHCVV